jgi:2-polyprenyl-3-methyl-5-hydroxy-6-metoxy-1,4-benzoquinol methylase
MDDRPRCWCGSRDLQPFSPDYFACGDCATLVAASMPERALARVEDEEQDFYGRRYWFEYQERELGTPDITVRARRDLPERCVYWLRTILRYRLPPARVVDVGCGHGGFVMLLGRAGFEATGLELSQWVVDFARRTFGVPVMQGPLEEQALAPESVDIITMMDVLEHLSDPVGTLRAALTKLGDAGLLVIQTPAVPPGLTWQAMLTTGHPFLPMMRERGHLYLFRDTGLRRLLAQLGVDNVVFEPAYFSAYDMFVVASRQPLACLMPSIVEEALQATPDSRVALAMLDLEDRWSGLQMRYLEAEQDRAARLAALHDHGHRLMAAQGDANVLRAEVAGLRHQLSALEAARANYVSVISERGARLAASEADRAARLAVIQEQSDRLSVLGHELAELRGHLAKIEADRAARLEVIEKLGRDLAASEADRAARLEVIEKRGRDLAASEADRAARLEVIEKQGRKLAASQADRAARLRVIHKQAEELQRQAEELQRQADRVQTLLTENQGLHAELAALRFHDVRVLVRKMVDHIVALRTKAPPSVAPPPPGELSPEATPPVTRASLSRMSPRLALPRAVTVHGDLDNYVNSIEAYTRTRPHLVSVRTYNHAMVDVLDSTVPLAGRILLDIGASPHGFSLERALAKGVAAYIGIGLGMWESVEIRHGEAIGRLMAGDAESIALESESIDLAMSLSTFEHFADGPAVLREIHRVLRPGGTLFVNFQPVWTSSEGHHLHDLEDVTRLIPPWAHLLWTPDAMRCALKDRWPAEATMSLDEAVAWIYESYEINRVDVVTLRRMFETAPFTIDWMTPLLDDESGDKPRLAAYLATLLPYSARDLLTRGFSAMLRKP